MVNTVVAAFEPGTDQELPIGQRGELCISGPCLMKGYYNKPEETAILLRRHPDGRVWPTPATWAIWTRTALFTSTPASSG